MSAPSEVLPNEDKGEEVKPPPKKRGRKRKSEILAQKIVEVIEKRDEVETVSRRGRPRKKVNYYELANPENVEDFPLQIQEQEKYFGTERDEPVKSKKRKNADKSQSDIELEEPEPRIEKKEIDVEEASKSSQPDKNGVVEKPDNNGNLTIPNGLDEEIIESAPSTSTPKYKDKRYSYTGETVKMMNTLFNFFAKKSDDSGNLNSTNNTSDSGAQELGKNGKRPYRKKKQQEKRVKEEEELDDGTGNVTCAICNSTVEKQLWRHHKQRYHNNLAWRVGDSPLDLSDQSLVMHTLNLLYKKKKPLYCDSCGEVKKSVVGFLSHRSQCLKSVDQLEAVKISCEICGRKMLPVSLSTHMKTIHMNPTSKEERIEKSSNENKPLPTKRSAATKAIKLIENVTKNLDLNKEKYFTENLDFSSQDFAKAILEKELENNQIIECKFKCSYIATDLENALKHFDECADKPVEGFACRECLFVVRDLEEIIYHIELVHKINIQVDDDYGSPEKSYSLPSFLFTTVKKGERVLFPNAFEWTLKFHIENFSDSLFKNLFRSNWSILPPNLVSEYLPKLDESCDVACRRVTCFINPLTQDYIFKKYQLFESDLHEDNKCTIFCGGPISSIAWLPTPYNTQDANQILAVSVLNCPDDKYITNDNFNEKGVIQFWNLGYLRNKEASMERAELVFGIGYDFGPVWHMEWCPSGCFNKGEGRMGLLAVTGSDSVVYVYAVPFFSKENSGLFYKPKPAIKLLLQRPTQPLFGGYKYYPTRISWSKVKGHNHIAVGYTNGFVAIYNLNSNSLLVKYQDGDVTCMLPVKCFQPHAHAITALNMYHLNGGCRWLLTGSIDRGVSVWDLNNYSYPIWNIKKNIVTEGFWFTHWLCNIIASDEGSTSIQVPTLLNQVRDFGCELNVSLLPSPSTVSSISGSDWLNGIVHGNAVGEIMALFPHQTLQIPDGCKGVKGKRLLFGFTYLVEKNKTPAQRLQDEASKKRILQSLSAQKKREGISLVKIKPELDDTNLFSGEPLLYEDAERKYALLFCDNPLRSYGDLPKTAANQLAACSKNYGITVPNQYPMTAINKIVFNPNRQASLYYATGYQSGFVRITWMEFLKQDQQIK